MPRQFVMPKLVNKICSVCGIVYGPKRKSYSVAGKIYSYPDIQNFKKSVTCNNSCSAKINGRRKNYTRSIMGLRVGKKSKTVGLNAQTTAYINTASYFMKQFGKRMSEMPKDIVRAKFAMYLMKEKIKGRKTPCLS